MKPLDQLKTKLREFTDPEKALVLPRFFKTGPGQYGEGDRFIGVSVPNQRRVARQFRNLTLNEVKKLIKSPWHEERLTGLFILIDQYKRADIITKKEIYEFYIASTEHINNWDLVDSSAGYIVGGWLDGRPEKEQTLDRLSKSELLWDRRIAIIATFYFIYKGTAEDTLRISENLLHDEADLIHKAVGWMLREVGKRVDKYLLLDFLEKHAAVMPRTMLRYSIEHLDAASRQHFLSLKKFN